MPTPNTAFARQVLEHIEAHPEEWDQGSWGRRIGTSNACGTAYCFAGHAVRMAHPNAVFLFGEGTSTTDKARDVSIPGNGIIAIRFEAMKLLDLSTYACDVLFEASNTLDHLRDYVAQLERQDSTGELACVNPRFGEDEDQDNAEDDWWDYDDEY